MHPWNLDETVSTMRFGERAKSIKTSAKVGVGLTPSQMKKQIKKMTDMLQLSAKMCNTWETKASADDAKKICANHIKKLKKHFSKDYPKELATADGAADAPAKGDDDEPEIKKSVIKKKAKERDAKSKEKLAAMEKELAQIVGKNDVLQAESDKIKAEFEKAKSDLEAMQSGKVLTTAYDHLKGQTVKIAGTEATGVVESVSNEDAVVIVDGKPTKVSATKLEEVKDENDVASLTRELRVYKYTLELTTREWKKNQNKAKEKIENLRNTIKKFKADKKALLTIVSDLEVQLQKRSMELFNKRVQAEQAGKKKITVGLGSMTRKEGDALAAFMANS
jgi:hypothetical protein